MNSTCIVCLSLCIGILSATGPSLVPTCSYISYLLVLHKGMTCIHIHTTWPKMENIYEPPTNNKKGQNTYKTVGY